MYFTQGLASILCVNCTLERARELREQMGNKQMEYWPLDSGILSSAQITIDTDETIENSSCPVVQGLGADPEILIYIEQINACISTLWASYRIYNPEELLTLSSLAEFTDRLVLRHQSLASIKTERLDDSLANVRKKNQVSSTLIEIGAMLSYAVTQGASGCYPILCNPSPFPHCSLLGVGGAVRGLTKFTRYLESAFMARDATKVIDREFPNRKIEIPHEIAHYESGVEYRFPASTGDIEPEFDRGGEFRQEGNVPLIVYLSSRHGLKNPSFRSPQRQRR